MRGLALRAQRPARTQRHDTGLVPNPAFPRVPPRPQFSGAARTAKLTTSQELVDLERVRTYHQQRVPPSTKRRPSHPAKDRGGPLRFQNVVTLSSPTNKSNPAWPP